MYLQVNIKTILNTFRYFCCTIIKNINGSVRHGASTHITKFVASSGRLQDNFCYVSLLLII